MTKTLRCDRQATCNEIRDFLGARDDGDLVMNIRHIGATPEEIFQAFEWLDGDDYVGASIRRRMDNNICRVYDILSQHYNRLMEER